MDRSPVAEVLKKRFLYRLKQNIFRCLRRRVAAGDDYTNIFPCIRIPNSMYPMNFYDYECMFQCHQWINWLDISSFSVVYDNESDFGKISPEIVFHLVAANDLDCLCLGMILDDWSWKWWDNNNKKDVHIIFVEHLFVATLVNHLKVNGLQSEYERDKHSHYSLRMDEM